MSMKPLKPIKIPNNLINKSKLNKEFLMKNKSKSVYKYGISETEVMKDKSLPYVTTFKDIKTPTTVDEFRENLQKYFVGWGDGIIGVGENEKNIGDFNVNDIECMGDLGIRDGFQWNGSDFHSPTLNLTPTVIQIKSWDKWSDDNFMIGSGNGNMGMEELCVQWWLNPQNNIIVDYQKMIETIDNDNSFGDRDYMSLCDKYQKNVYWKNFYKGGNSLFIDFYQKTLGEFGGSGEWSYDDEGNRLEVKEIV